jgi:lipoprotein-releasing system ATP-binding protein
MSEQLVLRDVVRSFSQAGETLEVLRGVNFTIRQGEMVALVGPSGAGKSTLLHVAGLLEQPTSGEVIIGGEDAARLADGPRTALRCRTIGFVYQFHHLLPEFSALENVVVPQMLAGQSRRDAAARAHELLSMVGLAHRETHRPGRLSGGEQQRVAIARALANKPALLLADEPTGNLDPHTAEDVFAMMGDLVRNSGLGALVATHNLELAARMDRILTLRDGRIETSD